MERNCNIEKKSLPGVLAVVLIIIYNVAVLTSGTERVIFLTKEDGIVEYVAVAGYLISAGIMFSLFMMSGSSNRTYLFKLKRNAVFLVLAILLIIFAGEEISWGQRILDFNSPEFWARRNRQGEMNLHNLNFWEALDTAGNQKHGIIRLFTSVALYTYFWFTLFLIIPILNKTWLGANKFFIKAGIPVIHILYGVLFLLNYIVFEIIERISVELRPVGEVKETNFAFLYLAACVYLSYKYGCRATARTEQSRLKQP